MKANQIYWINLYKELKQNCLCLDIETCYYNGPISVIGLYKPQEGEIICQQFIKDKNLTKENLKQAFKGCKLLLTYNGFALDIPKINSEFPNTIPKNIKIFDLYLFAKGLGINTNLKVLETTCGINRLKESSKRRGQTAKQWTQYKKNNNQNALNELLEYNKQDTINLYFLAEELIQIAEKIINNQQLPKLISQKQKLDNFKLNPINLNKALEKLNQ